MPKKRKSNRGFIDYNTYSFRDKSPMIGLFMTLRSQDGLSYEDIRIKSGGVAIGPNGGGNTERLAGLWNPLFLQQWLLAPASKG